MIDPYRFAAAGGGGAAPVFVAYAASNNALIAVPSGTANGDFMVAYVGSFNPSTITVPAGWTQVGSTAVWQSGQYTSALMYRAASSEPASYTFGSGGYNYGFIATYRGATAVDNSGSIQEFTTASMTLTGITCAAGSTLLACIHDRDDVSQTAPSGMTKRVESTAFIWRVGMSDLAGADSSNRTYVAASSSFNSTGVLISIK